MREPLVHIVIPVFNGAEHLRECLDSVLAQAYKNWQATIVNNCSTDETRIIADAYAKNDPRIRAIHYTDFVSQSANYNRALSHASRDAEYVKLMEADNIITEDSIEKMLYLAEKYRDVGIVGCYSLFGKLLLGSGLEYNIEVMTGQEAARMLFDGIYLVGTPSTLLFRGQALREQSHWFREGIFYDDVDLCLRIFRKWKFAFVHRLLTYVRVEEGRTFVSRYSGYDYIEAYLYFLILRYGSFFFHEKQLLLLQKKWKSAYYNKFARAFIKGQLNRAYWDFHRNLFAAEKQNMDLVLLILQIINNLLDLILNPKASVEGIVRYLSKNIQTDGYQSKSIFSNDQE